MILHLITLALVGTVVDGRPQSSAHVKFSSRLQTYSHGVDLPGRRGGYSEYLLERRSRLIEQYRPTLDYSRQSVAAASPEEMYPNGVFLPPDHEELHYWDETTGEDDPLLITGEEAKLAVANLFSRGSLYYNQIPHVRALRRHEEERRRNGLSVHLLSSNRPESPFYRGGAAPNRRRASFLNY